MTNFNNSVAQRLFDEGRYSLMNPVKERINVSKNPYDKEYRQHVFIGLRGLQSKVYRHEEEGLITEGERISIFAAWKRYGGKVLSNVHTERRVNNAARQVARLASNIKNDEQIIVKVIKR